MLPSKSPVVLILGAGTNIGANVARAFTAKGYKVALAARKLKDETNDQGQLTISSDFADPSSISAAFAKVREVFGDPSVVVYNGM
jgi:NAD(P)-dependent dehydrogenase (short-subunit alcohol dehydrogenase family)